MGVKIKVLHSTLSGQKENVLADADNKKYLNLHTWFQYASEGLYLDVLCVDISIGLQQQGDDGSVSSQNRPVQRCVLMILITQIHRHVKRQQQPCRVNTAEIPSN